MILKKRSFWLEGSEQTVKTALHPPDTADIAIIGGGFTGLATALHLARGGASVVLFETETLGFGCSSRSGGMCGPSFHKLGHAGLVQRYGEAKASKIMRESLDSLDYFNDFIQSEGLECDQQPNGRFRGAINAKDYEKLARDSDVLAKQVGLKFHAVPKSDQHNEIGSDFYHGGVVYENDAGIQPYKLVQELARKASLEGAQLFEKCPAIKIVKEGNGHTVYTPKGVTRVQHVIAATNGYTTKVLQNFRKRLIPILSGVIATEEMSPEKILELTPKLRMHGGTHRLVLWYRPSPDGRRLIIGGRVLDGQGRPEKFAPDLMALGRRVFPQLENTEVEFAWSGSVAYTFDHAPHIGQMDGVHYAMGYCGSGVTRSIYFARQLSRKILGQAGNETVFDDLPFTSKPFYNGNPWFVGPMLRWHALRDRMAGQ